MNAAAMLGNMSREEKGNSAKVHVAETGRVGLIALDLRKYGRNPY